MLTPLRLIVGAMASAMVVLAAMGLLFLQERAPDEAWPWLVVLAVALGAGVLAATVGFRVAPIDPRASEDDVVRLSRAALSRTTFLRATLTETPGIVALALGFVVESSVIVLVGVAISLILMFGIAWPGRIVLEKLQRGLDAGGANSRLASLSS